MPSGLYWIGKNTEHEAILENQKKSFYEYVKPRLENAGLTLGPYQFIDGAGEGALILTVSCDANVSAKLRQVLIDAAKKEYETETYNYKDAPFDPSYEPFLNQIAGYPNNEEATDMFKVTVMDYLAGRTQERVEKTEEKLGDLESRAEKLIASLKKTASAFDNLR